MSVEQMSKAAAAVKPKGLVVAGLGGGSGKSVVAVGLAAAFAGHGRIVAPFKKGPDYIDAGWLQRAAGRPCYNLDPYLMSAEALRLSFEAHARGAEIVMVEGNRGLHDGVNVEGAYSTAELAVDLGLPVLLVVDCTKTTRTVAAMVLGCRELDRRLDIRGVILNRIGSRRHGNIVRAAVEHYTAIPVLGVIPRQERDFFPQRHLGVTPCQEHEDVGATLASLADCMAQYTDLAGIEAIMTQVVLPREEVAQRRGASPRLRIGVLKDAAFQFYYTENLEALEQAGAELVEINGLLAPELPDIDGLYIGGGFPETNAHRLSANVTFRESIKTAAGNGLPIYAECGGLIYLGESIELEGEVFPLVGVFPVRFGLEKKPQAHGYSILETSEDNPYYRVGQEIKGHEFRYSRVQSWSGSAAELVFAMKRGVGFAGGRDGLLYRNVLALYTHIHALSTPAWAASLVARALEYKEGRKGKLTVVEKSGA